MFRVSGEAPATGPSQVGPQRVNLIRGVSPMLTWVGLASE